MDPYSSRLLETCRSTIVSWLGAKFDGVVRSQRLTNSVEVTRRDEVVGRAAEIALTELEHLFSVDVLLQRSNPLEVLRRCTSVVTEELARIGATEIERDEFHRRSFPTDLFGLSPATWADIDESLVEPGLEWGAFKAATVIQRQRDGSDKNDR